MCNLVSVAHALQVTVNDKPALKRPFMVPACSVGALTCRRPLVHKTQPSLFLTKVTCTGRRMSTVTISIRNCFCCPFLCQNFNDAEVFATLDVCRMTKTTPFY